MLQLLRVVRRFSPVLAILTVAGLLMLQPPASSDRMVMSPATSVGMAGAARPVVGMASVQGLMLAGDSAAGWRLSEQVDLRPAVAAAMDHRSMASEGADRGACVGCDSSEGFPGPMDCVAAGCLVLLVLLVGIWRIRPGSRHRGWSLPLALSRSRLETVILRCWASPRPSLVGLSISRT